MIRAEMSNDPKFG